jgi:hypothetical protein
MLLETKDSRTVSWLGCVWSRKPEDISSPLKTGWECRWAVETAIHFIDKNQIPSLKQSAGNSIKILMLRSTKVRHWGYFRRDNQIIGTFRLCAMVSNILPNMWCPTSPNSPPDCDRHRSSSHAADVVLSRASRMSPANTSIPHVSLPERYLNLSNTTARHILDGNLNPARSIGRPGATVRFKLSSQCAWVELWIQGACFFEQY